MCMHHRKEDFPFSSPFAPSSTTTLCSHRYDTHAKKHRAQVMTKQLNTREAIRKGEKQGREISCLLVWRINCVQSLCHTNTSYKGEPGAIERAPQEASKRAIFEPVRCPCLGSRSRDTTLMVGCSIAL